ncbi:MAG: hypothetical protein ACRER3_11950 [Pseudomonas fluorescens]
MTIDREKLSPETRQRVEELMFVNGWDFNRAINEMMETAIAGGALSEVGRRKAKVLQLVPPISPSLRDSSG